MTKEAKEILDKERQKIKVLADERLLLKILGELRKRVVANEDVLLTLINKTSLRLVKNANPASSNLILSSSSGAGKDYVTKAVCDLMVPKDRYEHVTDVSEKLLNYWNIPKNQGGSFDGFLLHLEDPQSERLKSQAFRVRSSGENAVRFVDRGKAKCSKINGKPVIIVTSLQATIDIEGMRRWDSIGVDESRRTTELMFKHYADSEAGLIDTAYDSFLMDALHKHLWRVSVKIPYAPAIINRLPTRLLMRTQIQKLWDYIKASAALHQHNRKKDDDGNIIANLFDYDYACFCFVHLGDVHGVALNKYEKEILEVLLTSHGDGLTVGDIASRVTLGKSSLYGGRDKNGYMEDLKEKGLVTSYINKDHDGSGRPKTLYIIKDDVEIATTLPTSPQMLEIMKNETNEQYKEIFKEVLENENGGFLFFSIMEDVNKWREYKQLRRIDYNEFNGLIDKKLDFLKRDREQHGLYTNGV